MYILKLSKVLICKFHYDQIKNKYDSKSKLLFIDIDSLMYEIKTANFSSGISIFDFSNYWTMSKYCDGSMTLVIGKMKDETGGVRIV